MQSSSFESVVLLGRGMPHGEQEATLGELAQRIVAEGRAQRCEVAFVEMTAPTLEDKLDEMECAGVTQCLIVPVIVPFDRNLAAWLPRALSRRAHEPERRMRVSFAEPPDAQQGFAELIDSALDAAHSIPDIREVAKPLTIKPGASRIPAYRHMAMVCLGPRCASAGSWQLLHRLRERLGSAATPAAKDGRVVCVRTACLGPCNHAPVMVVQPDDVWYSVCDDAAVDAIVARHLRGDQGKVAPWARTKGERLVLADGSLAEPEYAGATATVGAIQIKDFVVRPAMKVPGALAAFGLIKLSDSTPDTLLDVRLADSQAAAALHDPALAHAGLRPGIGLPRLMQAHGSLNLMPGGLHLMLLGLESIPESGEVMDLEFQFERHGTLGVRVRLNPPAQ